MDLGISVALEQINKYQSQMSLITRTTNRAMGTVGASISKVRGSWNSLVTQVPALGVAMNALRNPIVGVAIALAGIASQGTAAIKVTRDFQKQVADTAAIVGIQKTDAAYSALIDKARQLGRDTEFSATESANAMEFLARAGFTAEQSIASAESTLALATVGNLNLAKSADIASNVMSQFGLTTDDTAQQAANLGRVVDVIAKTTTSSNTNITQFATAMNYLGATADALQIPIEEASAAIGILANSGLQGSLATRAISTSLVNLTKPTKAARIAMKDIGLEAFNAKGEFVGLAGLVGQLETAYKDFTPEQTQASLATIFGAEAIQEMNILLKAGSEELVAYTADIQSAGNQQGKFAEQIRKTKLDNLDGAIRILKSSYQDFQIELGSRVEPALTSFIRKLTDVIRGITNFIQTSQGLRSIGKIFSAISSAMAPVRAAIQNVVNSIRELVGEMAGNLVSASGNLASVFGALASGAAQGLALAINGIAVAVNVVAAIFRASLAIFRQFETLIIAVTGAIAANIIVTKALAVAQVAGRAISLGFAAAQALLSGNVLRASAAMKLLGLSTKATSVVLRVAAVATKAMATVTALATGKLKLVTVAQRALNLVLKANPIGIVISLIGAAAAALTYWYRTSDTARAKFAGAFAYIKTIFANFFSGFVLQAAGAAAIFDGIFSLDVEKIKQGVNALGEGLRRQTIDIAKGAAEAYTKAYNEKIVNDAAKATKEAAAKINAEVAQLTPAADISVVDGIRERIDKDLKAGVITPEQAEKLKKSLENTLAKPIADGVKAATGSIKSLEDQLSKFQTHLNGIAPNPQAFAEIQSNISSLEKQIAEAKLQQIEVRANFPDQNLIEENIKTLLDGIEGIDLQVPVSETGADDMIGRLKSLVEFGVPDFVIQVKENGLDAIRQSVTALSADLIDIEAKISVEQNENALPILNKEAEKLQDRIALLNKTRIEIQSGNVDILRQRVEALTQSIGSVSVGPELDELIGKLKTANIELAEAQIFRLETQTQSIDVLGQKLQLLQDLSNKIGPSEPVFESVILEIKEVEQAIQRIKNAKILIEAGIKIDPNNIQISSVVIPDINISANLNVESNIPTIIPQINEMQAAAERFGFTQEYVNNRFRNTADLLNVVNTGAFDFISKMGASADQAAEFAIGLEGLKSQIEETFINGISSAFSDFGREMGKAVATGESATAAFQTLFKGLLSVVLSEIPKLIGTFLIQTGVGMGFPAGLPFFIGGIGLLAFSGLASGLISKIGGQQAEQQVPVPNASEVAVAGAAATGSSSGGLAGVSAEREQQTIVVNNTIVLESDGILTEIQKEQIIQNENRFGG